jgi:plasmid maintenance system antidote protein VapI
MNNPLGYTDPSGYFNWRGVGDMFLGYYDAGKAMVTGTISAAAHPIDTVKGHDAALAHPIVTAKAICNATAQAWNSGDRGKGEVIGTILLTAATVAAPAARAGSVSKAAEVANAASKTEEAVSAAQEAGNVARDATSIVERGAGRAESGAQPVLKQGDVGVQDAQKAGAVADTTSAPAAATSSAAAGNKGTALARQLGQAGEDAAQIVKNTERIPSLTDTAAYRIPDVLDHSAQMIGEVKNVGKLSLTSQLKDFSLYAQQRGYQFQLFVSPTTVLSGPLQGEVANGNIILNFLK